jgi:hypothetical protein
VSDVIRLAEERQLPACAALLRAFPAAFPAPAPLDDLLKPPLPTDESAYAYLMRRGLDARLWRVVRDTFADRPLERGLLAWDVLTGSLLDPTDTQTLAELRGDARLIRAILPDAGQRGIRPRHPQAAALIEALRPKRLLTADRTELGQAVAAQVLGSYELLRRLEGHDRQALELWTRWGRMLSRAHLPALASFYLDEVWSRQGHRPALPDLVEALLDAEVPGVTEWLEGLSETDPTQRPLLSELSLYAKIRSSFASNTTAQFVEWVERDRVITEGIAYTPEQAGSLSPWPTIAYTDIGLKHGKRTVTLPVIAAAVKHQPEWRYGLRVLDVLSARESNQKSPDFTQLLARYLQLFGNQHQLWHGSASFAGAGCAWLGGLASMLSRELRELPHDPEVWRAVAWVFDAGGHAQAALSEISDRLRHQSLLESS